MNETGEVKERPSQQPSCCHSCISGKREGGTRRSTCESISSVSTVALSLPAEGHVSVAKQSPAPPPITHNGEYSLGVGNSGGGRPRDSFTLANFCDARLQRSCTTATWRGVRRLPFNCPSPASLLLFPIRCHPRCCPSRCSPAPPLSLSDIVIRQRALTRSPHVLMGIYKYRYSVQRATSPAPVSTHTHTHTRVRVY